VVPEMHEAHTAFTGSNQPTLDDPQPLRRKEFAALLHHSCFYPRAIASMVDATFVARFVRYLHDWNADRFSLLAVYEHVSPAGHSRSGQYLSALSTVLRQQAWGLHLCMHRDRGGQLGWVGSPSYQFFAAS
jgi:hypothetical protein